MFDVYSEENWKIFLEEHPKLKELVVKAGLENNPKRVKELDGAFAVNCGEEIVKSNEERELAKHLFVHDYRHPNGLNNALKGRIIAAKEAGIALNDL